MFLSKEGGIMFFSKEELKTLLYALNALPNIMKIDVNADLRRKLELSLESKYKKTIFGGKGYNVSYEIGRMQYKESVFEGKREFEGLCYRKGFIYVALGLPTYYPDSARIELAERLFIVNQVFKDRADHHICTLFRESAVRIKKLLEN